MSAIFASDLWTTLANPSQGLVTLVLIAAFLLFLVVCVGGAYWVTARRMDHEAALKRDMLDRGMSPDEIERVIAARLGEPPDAPD
jgi:hypothetical protein